MLCTHVTHSDVVLDVSAIDWAMFCCVMLYFWVTVFKTVRPMLSDRCLSVLSICDVRALWPNGCTDQDETWHAGSTQRWPHCVRWGPSSPPKKGAEPPPQFSAHFYCHKTAGRIKMPLGMDAGLGRGDFVLDGDPAPSPKRGLSPQFSAHLYCGQTAGWIKMPLGTKVGLSALSPGDCVRWEPISPSPKRGWSPLPSL